MVLRIGGSIPEADVLFGKGGNLIERQADYLRQAYNIIANYATEDELDYNWLPSVMMI